MLLNGLCNRHIPVPLICVNTESNASGRPSSQLADFYYPEYGSYLARQIYMTYAGLSHVICEQHVAHEANR
jgi:hypothetical protein